MNEIVTTKTLVSLIEDYDCEDSMYPEENCFIPSGSEGLVLDEHTIELIPDLSDEIRSRLIRRLLRSGNKGNYLLLIKGQVIEIPKDKVEVVTSWRGTHFEDEKDFKDYLEEMDEIIKKQYSEIKNAST